LGRLITPKGYQLLKEKAQPLIQRFMAIRDEIYERYSELIEERKEDFKPLAVQKWKLINPTEPDVPEEFVFQEVEKLASYFPDRESLKDNFDIKWDLSWVQLPKTEVNLAEEEAERLRQQKEVLNTEIEDLERRIQSVKDGSADVLAKEEATKYAEMEMQKFRLVAEKNRIEKEEAIRLEMAEEIQRTAYQKITQTVEAFGQEINELLYRVATDMLVSLEDSKTGKRAAKSDVGTVRGRAILSLNQWVESIRSMNFMETSEAGQKINDMMSEVEGFVKKSSFMRTEADKRNLKDVLLKIRGTAAQELMALKVSPRTEKEMERPDVIEPAEKLVRRIKESVGAPPVVAAEKAAVRGRVNKEARVLQEV
jgi:hypothetical protein